MRQKISRHSLPKDFFYFRSRSEGYRKYLEGHGYMTMVPCGKKGEFWWVKNVFWGLFQIAKFERTSEAPDMEIVRAAGFKRGMLIWVPSHDAEIPKGWRKLLMPGGHFVNTGFSVVENEYWKKWNERARRARKKFLALPSHITIREVDHTVFAEAFLQTKVTHWFKRDFVRFFEKMSTANTKSVRAFLAYKDDTPLAGLAVHDFENISVHLVAFTAKEAKPLQLGTGLMDYWYKTSLEKNIKYLHFDHFKDAYMTSDQQGYTDFKTNFCDFLVRFPEAYFRWK